MNTFFSATRPVDVYRAAWRWHFYAGLLVLPFMLILAVTGAIYLFHTEIDDYIYRDIKIVKATAGSPHSHETIVQTALAAYPGQALRYVPPASKSGSAEVDIKGAGGDVMAIYVDPYRGTVLGSMPNRGSVSWTIRRLHSLAYFGPIANGMIEVAAGWCILLVITGTYLWWPRQNTSSLDGLLKVRGVPSQRVFWRDVHAVTGIIAGVFILFLAVTGMPWSIVWGDKVNQWANDSNFGYPAGVRVSVPMSDEHINHVAPVAWSLEQAKAPTSATHVHPASDAAMHTQISLDKAVSIFDQLGLAKTYAINLPVTTTGVFTGSVYPNDLAKQRVVHLDQFSGQVLLDMSFADYGPVGKGLEWGINVHLGQEFGLANQLLMLAVCCAIVLLCISSAVMWWKRRPAGMIGIPPLPANRRALKLVFILLMLGGIIFPLVGISMLLMLALDYVFVIRRNTVD